MNGLDILLVIAFIPAIITGLKKGFLEQLLALAGLIAGVWAAYMFSSLVSKWLRPYINASDTLLSVISFIIILLVVCFLVYIASRGLCKLVKTSFINWVDKLLGVVASCIITALLLSAVIVSFDALNTNDLHIDSELINGSVIYGFLKKVGYFVFPYLKHLLLKS